MKAALAIAGICCLLFSSSPLLAGDVVWVNETENGLRHNVTISRLYRDEQQGQWKDSTSFGRDDLPLVAKVADQAHSWIYQAQARAAQSGDAGQDVVAAGSDESQAVPVGAGAGGDIPF